MKSFACTAAFVVLLLASRASAGLVQLHTGALVLPPLSYTARSGVLGTEVAGEPSTVLGTTVLAPAPLIGAPAVQLIGGLPSSVSGVSLSTGQTVQLAAGPAAVQLASLHVAAPAAVQLAPAAALQLAPAVVPAIVQAEGSYVAATRGAVHTAPLPGHALSASSINLQPAPGTL